MANGDCPVGARNSADISNLGRTCDELRGEIRELRLEIRTLTEGQTAMKIADAWDWKKVALALVLIALSSGGGGVLAQVLKIVE